MTEASESSNGTEGGGKFRNALSRMKSKTTSAIKTIQDKSKVVRDKGMEKVQQMQEKGKDAMAQAQARRAPDVMVDTEEDGLESLKQMVEEAKTNPRRRPEKWSFEASPLDCFEKTKDDLLMAFVRWSRLSDANSDQDSLDSDAKYNISKAFRRLESYANWMLKTGTDMTEPPLTKESIQEAWGVWSLKVSYDKHNRLVWWMDMDAVDAEAVQELKPVDSLRLFCWFAHYVLLDRHAQQYGMVLVQNLGKKHLLKQMALMPPKLMLKIDRLTIGTMPVKTKQLYIVRSPQWAKLVMGLAQPFLSQKLRQRIVTLPESKTLEELLGADCIPQEFPGCEGKLERDVVWATYFA